MWNSLDQLNSSINPDDYPEFAIAFREIDQSYLHSIIQLLYPLVQSIDYCQRYSGNSDDDLAIIKQLRDYYLDKGVDGLTNEEVEDIFSERQTQFIHLSDGLRELFSLPANKILDDEEKNVLAKKCIDELCKLSIPNMEKQEIENIAYIEVPLFISSGALRKGLSVSGFFESFNNRRLENKFVLLPRVYEQVKSQVVFVITAERSLREKERIHISPPRLQKTRNVNNLRMIECNLKFSQNGCREHQLRKHLFDNNPLKEVLGK